MKPWIEEYYRALKVCGQRYIDMYDPFEADDLYHFMRDFMDGCTNKMPLQKMNRWLGYIQGQLIALGYTTVEQERDWSRSFFRPLDFPED